MTIPANLTHTEAGALLVAVGKHMIDHDVCAEAVLDPEAVNDPSYAALLCSEINDASWAEVITIERAEELLKLTLEEAVSFVRLT